MKKYWQFGEALVIVALVLVAVVYFREAQRQDREDIFRRLG